MVKSGERVQPLINLLRDRLLCYDIISMDETRLQVLKEAGKSAQSPSYLWVQRGGPPEHPILLYDYDPSRNQQVPMRLLQGFKGYLQTDGYQGYAHVCAENDLIALGCWAHARRKFDEARKAQPATNSKKQKTSLAARTSCSAIASPVRMPVQSLQPHRNRKGQWHRAVCVSENRVHRITKGDNRCRDRSVVAGAG